MDDVFRQKLDREWLVSTCKKAVGGRSVRSVAINELNMTGPGLTRWLSGEVGTDNISLKGFRALAAALGMTPVELMQDYESYLNQGDQGGGEPDKSKIAEILKVLGITQKSLLQIETLAMAEFSNSSRVKHLSDFLKAFLSHHGLQWDQESDRLEFAESAGVIGSHDCPWRADDVSEPDGLLYRIIAGEISDITRSILFGIALSCSALAQKRMTVEELESICNGSDPSRWFSYCNHH